MDRHSHDGGASFAPANESRLTPSFVDTRPAPDALGYFVGRYSGLDNAGTPFNPTWAGVNDGDLANRTDVFHRAAG